MDNLFNQNYYEDGTKNTVTHLSRAAISSKSWKRGFFPQKNHIQNHNMKHSNALLIFTEMFSFWGEKWKRIFLFKNMLLKISYWLKRFFILWNLNTFRIWYLHVFPESLQMLFAKSRPLHEIEWGKNYIYSVKFLEK